MPFYMEMKRQQLDDPGVRQLYRDLMEVTRGAEDPRMDDVADRLAAEFEAVPEDAWGSGAPPDDLAALLDAVFLDSVPGPAGSCDDWNTTDGPAGPTSVASSPPPHCQSP
jgi:hypothetical protein